MPGVKGKSGPRKPPRSPKKLTKVQKVAKKLQRLDNKSKSMQKVRENCNASASRRLEISPVQMKSDIEICNIIRNFEYETAKLKHNKCQCCRMVRLGLQLNRKGICKKCTPLKNEKYYLEAGALPVWYNDQGVPQYYVPSVLSSLTQAEKLLIQRVSPFVPLQHLKQGTFGISGHVCAFEQDVNEFLVRLPRQKNDVSMLKVLRTIQTEIGNTSGATVKAFRVRKKAVLLALKFLKKHNTQYHDIPILHKCKKNPKES